MFTENDDQNKTTQKSAQEVLELPGRAMASVANAIIITDHAAYDEPVVYVNPAFSLITGYSKQEALGRNCRFLQGDDRQQKPLEEVRAALKEHRQCHVLLKNYRKNGEMFWNELEISPVFNKEKTVTHFIAVISDVTNRKLFEQERERLLNRLEEKNKELQTFASVIHHNLGNSLLSIQAFTIEMKNSFDKMQHLLADQKITPHVIKQLSQILNTNVSEDITYVEVSIAEMYKLLAGLKQSAGVGRASIDIEQQNMNKLVRHVVGEMKSLIKDANASIDIANLPDCLADASQLNKVFENLITNALKYLDSLRRGEIKISGYINHNMAIYCIEDNGMGIAPHQQEKVFDIFYRCDPDGPIPGEGLGLLIVQKIIERHNGKTWFESEQGKGSKFYVALPKA